MKTSSVHTRLMARMKGSCCITVDGDGNVTGSQPPLTARAGEDATAHQPIPEVAPDAGVRDPAAPPETEEEKAARLANETPEQKTAREAAETAAQAEADKAEALKNETPEQKTAREAKEALEADTAKKAEAEAKDKAWAERDTTKDVPVTAEQKAEIAKLAKTPEQIAAMEAFTLETNTTNDLSPASRAKAAELWGVTPEMVDRYVASVISQNDAAKGATTEFDDNSEDPAKWSPTMQQALKDRVDALHAVAGGQKVWDDFAAWADKGLNAEQKATLQQAIHASPALGATIAKQYIAAWKANGGGDGPLDLSRGAGTAPGTPQAKVQPFASKEEQNAALNDPRYGKDAAYRNSVDARMVVSNFAQNVEKSFYAGAGGMMGA